MRECCRSRLGWRGSRPRQPPRSPCRREHPTRGRCCPAAARRAALQPDELRDQPRVAVRPVGADVGHSLREASKRIEAQVFGQTETVLDWEGNESGYWVSQRGTDGESFLNARQSREQGLKLASITAFTFNAAGEFKERIEAQDAELTPGAWRLTQAKVYAPNEPPASFESYMLPTRLTGEQVAESFAAPDTVGFWHLPTYIRFAEDSGLAAAGYRLQYQLLIARPFLLGAMILLAASVSLRAFRFGGVPQRILIGVTAGFVLYVLSKVTEDLSKADLLNPLLAAWLPIAAGGLSGLLVLLHEEDG
jgi:lipopolysaccharide export system permease protein